MCRMAGIAEIGSGIPENQARDIATLMKDPVLTDIPRFSDVDFRELAEVDDDAGLCDFVVWLGERPEANVLVVCHHNVILKLLNMHGLRNKLSKVP